MKKTFWEKRIPTFLGLLIITIAIGITTLLVGQNTSFVQQASPTSAPQEIRITNISDSAFTISYTTAGLILGSINFGKDQQLGQTISDEADKPKITERKIHSFKIENLDPSTKYYFSIISGQDSYLNNGVPYETTTGPKISAKSGTAFIVGKIITLDNLPPKEAIVYITATGSQPLSTTVKSDGSYTLSLENLRKDDLTTFFTFNSNANIKMLVIGDSGQSTAEISAKDINYVPTIVISKNYDFTQSLSEVASSSAKLQFPTITTSSGKNPQIIIPTQDQNFSSQKPLFKGKGIPNDKINISIHSSEQIQGTVTVDTGGNWTFIPLTPISSGQHTITISAKDSNGILRTITQTFTIQEAEAASPSPSLTPTPSASPISFPSASAIPSATPIIISTPTPTPVVIKTPIPTLLPTGTSEVSVGLMGATLTIVGGIFFFLSRFLL